MLSNIRIHGFLLGLLLSSSVLAHERGLTASLGWWDSKQERLGARLAYRFVWHQPLFTSGQWQVTGFYEPSVAQWRALNPDLGDTTHLWAVAFSPVIQVVAPAILQSKVRPFLSLGIGLAWLSGTELGGRRLGSQGHFEDRLGFGMVLGHARQYEVSYRFMHYSNCGIAHPNSGLNFNVISLTRLW